MNMVVYIVLEGSYDGDLVVGVYHNREAAEAHVASIEDKYHREWHYIEEREVLSAFALDDR